MNQASWREGIVIVYAQPGSLRFDAATRNSNKISLDNLLVALDVLRRYWEHNVDHVLGTRKKFPCGELYGKVSVHYHCGTAMKLVGRNRLDEFCTKHPEAKSWIEIWLADVEAAKWATPHHLKERYSSASMLGDGLCVFNVKGNGYRLEATIAYKTGIVVVVWVGTHAEYDERNKKR